MPLPVTVFPTNAAGGLLVSIMQDEHNGLMMSAEKQLLSNLCLLAMSPSLMVICATSYALHLHNESDITVCVCVCVIGRETDRCNTKY